MTREEFDALVETWPESARQYRRKVCDAMWRIGGGLSVLSTMGEAMDIEREGVSFLAEKMREDYERLEAVAKGADLDGDEASA